MENMRIYDAVRSVPKEAQKPITAGRLKGFTDINPMWRIKKMTEMFGPCGKGWGYKSVNREFVPGEDGVVACFVDIELWYKDGGEVCTVYGTGGSSFVAKEKSGLYTSDEAVKMATTDAMSFAMKNLGVAADIYYAKDRTKYTAQEQPAEQRDTGADEFQAFIDGETLGDKPCTKVQIAMIERACTNGQVEAICRSRKVRSLSELTAEQAAGIIKGLEKKGMTA